MDGFILSSFFVLWSPLSLCQPFDLCCRCSENCTSQSSAVFRIAFAHTITRKPNYSRHIQHACEFFPSVFIFIHHTPLNLFDDGIFSSILATLHFLCIFFFFFSLFFCGFLCSKDSNVEHLNVPSESQSTIADIIFSSRRLELYLLHYH